MISKSVMIQTAQAAGGNVVFIDNGILTIAEITTSGIAIVATAATGDGDIILTDSPLTDIVVDPADADSDDTELLGSLNLAAGGRALAKRGDAGVALVKGSGGWVGVRA